jgi:hypothetical protein
MARGLFETICVAAFTAPVAAACLHAWPFVVGRPSPSGFDVDVALLGAVSLLVSAGLTMLMSASIQSSRRRR